MVCEPLFHLALKSLHRIVHIKLFRQEKILLQKPQRHFSRFFHRVIKEDYRQNVKTVTPKWLLLNKGFTFGPVGQSRRQIRAGAICFIPTF